MHLIFETKHHIHFPLLLVSSPSDMMNILWYVYMIFTLTLLRLHIYCRMRILHWLCDECTTFQLLGVVKSAVSRQDHVVVSAESHWTKKEADWVMLWQYQCCTLMADCRLHPFGSHVPHRYTWLCVNILGVTVFVLFPLLTQIIKFWEKLLNVLSVKVLSWVKKKE